MMMMRRKPWLIAVLALALCLGVGLLAGPAIFAA